MSTGQAGHRTPTGVFSVIGKERWHHSNIYSGAPMPWMQRITWSGVAMHAGVVPGYPASHGCIRLPAGFAPQLYGMTKMGARVVVTPRDIEPVEFTHTPAAAAEDAAGCRRHSAGGGARRRGGRARQHGHDTSTMSDRRGARSRPRRPMRPQPLNPIAYAAALKERATADKVVADKAAKDALAAAQTAGAEARQAVDDVRKAEADRRRRRSQDCRDRRAYRPRPRGRTPVAAAPDRRPAHDHRGGQGSGAVRAHPRAGRAR